MRARAITLAAVLLSMPGVGATAQDIQTRFGGRVQNDWAWFIQNDASETAFGDVLDATEFRRARFFVSGTIYRDVEFKVQYDFAGGDADFKDAYIGVRGVPGTASIRVGHQKEPFGLEGMTSSKYLQFMERSLASGFALERNTGILAHNHVAGDRVTWAAGIFKDADGFGDGAADGGYNITGRVTGLPWVGDDGARLLHVGFSFSKRNPVDDEVRYRVRPEMHLAPRLVDTGTLSATSVTQFGTEIALQYDRFAVQSEYIGVMPSTAAAADPSFNSMYVRGGFFLTNDRRRYSRSSGAWGRVRPAENFLTGGEDRGSGAWEVVFQYSTIDLTDGAVIGGELENISAGLNWYLNPNSRLMFDYVTSSVTGGEKLSAFMTRFAVDF